MQPYIWSLHTSSFSSFESSGACKVHDPCFTSCQEATYASRSTNDTFDKKFLVVTRKVNLVWDVMLLPYGELGGLE